MQLVFSVNRQTLLQDYIKFTPETSSHREELVKAQEALDFAVQGLQQSSVRFDALMTLESRLVGEYSRDWVHDRADVSLPDSFRVAFDRKVLHAVDSRGIAPVDS